MHSHRPPAQNAALHARVLLALIAICATTARAGEPVALPEVSVSASRIERENFDLPVAVDTVNRQRIREDNAQVNLSEALNSVPGIVVQNRQNYAQDLQISSRGFGGRASFGVRGVRLIADGIPATMPDGQGQAASFDLGAAQRIEVLRGPFSSLYGNASGGVVQVFTADGPAEPTLGAGLYYGSFKTRKLDTRFGGQSGLANYTLGASAFATSGYRDHSSARRDQASGKLTVDGGDRGTLTFTVNALDQPETQDPLGLTAAQVAQNRRQAGTNAIAFNTRKSIGQSQGGVTYDLDVGAQGRVQARGYLGDRQVTQYLAIPLAAQNLATASGGVVDLDRSYGGGGLRWTHGITGPFTVSAGLDYDRLAELRKGYMNNAGVSGALKRNEDDTVTSTDVYAQAEWQMSAAWLATGGVRHSRVKFASRDYFITAGNPDDSGGVTYVRTLPVGGITYKATPDVHVYGNIGRGFETPTFAELAYRPGGASGLNFALRPAVSLQRELGVKAQLGAAGRVSAALYRTDVTDEIVVNSSAGGRSDFKNAGHTRREGLEFAWAARLPRNFEATLAYTTIDARFTDSFVSGTPAVTVPAGSRLPGVPGDTLYGELVWRHAGSGFHTAGEVRRNGRVYVNDANTEAAGAYAIANVRAGFEQRGKNWRVAEFVRVDNVTDRAYIGSVIVADANGRYYEPAPGRNYLVGVTGEFRF